MFFVSLKANEWCDDIKNHSIFESLCMLKLQLDAFLVMITQFKHEPTMGKKLCFAVSATLLHYYFITSQKTKMGGKKL